MPSKTVRSRAIANVRSMLHGPKDIRIENSTINPPGPGEAQVKIVTTGICGSDLHYYMHARNGDFVHEEPAVLGHESAGIITAVGENVDLKVGQRVAIEPGIHCGFCRLCKMGRYNLCPDMRYCSSAKSKPILHGTLQSYMNHPACFLQPMPDACTYEQAALVEPLSIVLHATRRVPIAPGQAFLVFGAGPVGLLACALAKALGAALVVVVDIDERRVKFATEQGFATGGYVVSNAPRPATSEESLKSAKATSEELLERFRKGTDGFDVVYECSGVEVCLQAAIYAARIGGKVAVIGMGTSVASLPISFAAFREVDIIGVFRYTNTYPEALALFGANRLEGVEKLVTTRYPLEQTKEAFESLLKGTDDQGDMVMKVMISN